MTKKHNTHPKKGGNGRKLTHKRRAFVDAYMGEAAGNCTKAARLAGYKQPQSMGSQLLGFIAVKEEIARRTTIETETAAMSRGDIAEFFRKIVVGDIADVKIERRTGEVVEAVTCVKDRMRAAELLAKMGGHFIERRDITSNGESVAPRQVFIMAGQEIEF